MFFFSLVEFICLKERIQFEIVSKSNHSLIMKMPVTYDKLNKVWTNSERDPHAEVRTSLTTHIWKWMAMHGDKIAQV